MCPPGCYHNGFMATPELGHRMYGSIYVQRQYFAVIEVSLTAKYSVCIIV